MKFLKEKDFARWCALHESLVDNSLDGYLTELEMKPVESFIDDLARVDFRKCRADYFFHTGLVRFKLWGEEPDDIVILEFSPMTYQTEVVFGYDRLQRCDRNKKVPVLKRLMRMLIPQTDMYFDPMECSFKFNIHYKDRLPIV